MAITAGIINRCLEECYKSTYHFRIGAVIFNSKRIISSGHNGLRTSSNIPDKHKNFINSLHAEQAAILNVNWNKVKGCSILVMKISKTKGSLSNARPCTMCYKILKHVGIKKIYYTNEQGEIVLYEE